MARRNHSNEHSSPICVVILKEQTMTTLTVDESHASEIIAELAAPHFKGCKWSKSFQCLVRSKNGISQRLSDSHVRYVTHAELKIVPLVVSTEIEKIFKEITKAPWVDSYTLDVDLNLLNGQKVPERGARNDFCWTYHDEQSLRDIIVQASSQFPRILDFFNNTTTIEGIDDAINMKNLESRERAIAPAVIASFLAEYDWDSVASAVKARLKPEWSHEAWILDRTVEVLQSKTT